jgi:hypothetical protein
MKTTIKLKKSDLPKGFRVVDVRKCPECGCPIIFGLSDAGFNTICDGEPCCFAIINHLITKMREHGYLSEDATLIDVLQAETEIDLND